jgi:hypothetical protein
LKKKNLKGYPVAGGFGDIYPPLVRERLLYSLAEDIKDE